MNASINVSNYTASVDSDIQLSKNKRSHKQAQNIYTFLTSLVFANSYPMGQTVLEEKNFAQFEDIIKDMLEIARRYKITNPEKLRSEYGKLIMLMQDAVSPDIESFIGYY